ncbi:hypothetical protein Ddc_19565 [Ditylenchus destructor]|nr:hypothetical protein Ddc_19565 [Ditylenchus destructor]
MRRVICQMTALDVPSKTSYDSAGTYPRIFEIQVREVRDFGQNPGCAKKTFYAPHRMRRVICQMTALDVPSKTSYDSAGTYPRIFEIQVREVRDFGQNPGCAKKTFYAPHRMRRVIYQTTALDVPSKTSYDSAGTYPRIFEIQVREVRDFGQNPGCAKKTFYAPHRMRRVICQMTALDVPSKTSYDSAGTYPRIFEIQVREVRDFGQNPGCAKKTLRIVCGV